MKQKKTLLGELANKDRKYDSIVDEYRRIFQTGKVMTINNKDLQSREKMFELGVQFILKNLKLKAELKDIFIGKKINTGKTGYKKIEIIEFNNSENEKIISIEAISNKNHIIKTSFSIIPPWMFNRHNKIQYYERYKLNRTLFGLSDHYKKLLLRKRCDYKASLLVDNICKKMSIAIPSEATRIIQKINKKGEIAVS